jgi:polyisoprenoid-binding protein YceI
MHKRFALPLAALLVLALNTQTRAATWKIDSAHSSAQFQVTHMMISKVSGSFSEVEGQVALDGEDVSSAMVEATIPVSTIYTGAAKRDAHLKSPDFFDVEKYPTLIFKSAKVTKTGDGSLKVAGQLTLHGVTRDVVLDVQPPSPAIKGPKGESHIGLAASTTLQRKDFGISWNKILDSGGVMISEEVKVTLNIELVEQIQ